MKKIIAFCFVAALSSCCQSRQTRPPEIIAEIGGCKIYKIDGGPRWVYTTICPSRARTEWSEQHGKTSIKQGVDTVESQ